MLTLCNHGSAVYNHVVHAGTVLTGVGEGCVDGQILQRKYVHIRIEAGKQNASIFQLVEFCRAGGSLAYRLFHGDHTQFPEVNRIMQNHIFSYESGNILFERFYPTDELKLCETDKEYTNLVENVFEILHNTMQCVSKKWRNPAISLTGGMDSKTTLASTNGLYDKFKYYSYVSMDGDKIDADAAHSISNHLGLEHNIFYISDNDSDFQNIDIMRAVIEHNNGGYRINDNNARKRFFFNPQYFYR